MEVKQAPTNERYFFVGDRPKHGGANFGAWKTGGGDGMAVTIELNGADGTKQTHEVARGGGTDPHSPLDPLGLTLDDGKTLLAGVQRHVVQARVAEYSELRRHCSHCRGLRPLKDTRTRRLSSLFGTVEVPAPRFKPCRCAVAARSTLCPASELMTEAPSRPICADARRQRDAVPRASVGAEQ